MKIEKRIYRIFYRGKRYSLPLFAVTEAARREKVSVRSLPAQTGKKR